MDIIQFLKQDACSVSLSSRHKKECVRELAQILSRVLPDIPAENLNAAFMEREEQGSTAFENGVAIPHARIKELDSFYVGIALSRKGVDFQSMTANARIFSFLWSVRQPNRMSFSACSRRFLWWPKTQVPGVT
ncbi:MAG: PTS sugar transporter subunit IIA [candidate division KSB1 bacterium]|nr:PTS sugar transporter subunit IIA [candidate division KSB1 bacterium]